MAGRVLPAMPAYQVGAEKLREFAQAVGATDGIYRDKGAAQSAGYADVVAPFTFAAVIAQRAEFEFTSMPEADIDFSRVVHASERMTYTRPIVAGDSITAQLTVESVVARGANTFVTTRCELTDSAGALVATVTSTLAVRG